MCGRKTLTKGKMEIIEELSIRVWDDSVAYQPSFNVAPTHIVPILLYDNQRSVKPMRWGLIPDWVKDEGSVSILINARAETVDRKPSFRNLLPGRRCAVITDGYYEWKREQGYKQPYYISRPDHSLMPLAGLWNLWRDGQGKSYYTYTVITTDANPALDFIHKRMPVILPPDSIDGWIDTTRFSADKALPLLKPYEAELSAYPVSTYVNAVRNNSEKCIQRLTNKF